MRLKNTWAPWRPPGETIEAVAAVLRSRWSAVRSQPEGLFWAKAPPAETSWLRRRIDQTAHQTLKVLQPYHLTSGGRLIK